MRAGSDRSAMECGRQAQPCEQVASLVVQGRRTLDRNVHDRRVDLARNVLCIPCSLRRPGVCEISGVSQSRRGRLKRRPERQRRRFSSARVSWSEALSLQIIELCADGGIGGLKRRLWPPGRAATDANEPEQGEETYQANDLPVIGHHSLTRLPQLLARRGADYATIFGNSKGRPSKSNLSEGCAL
jgi:hypothetical protein